MGTDGKLSLILERPHERSHAKQQNKAATFFRSYISPLSPGSISKLYKWCLVTKITSLETTIYFKHIQNLQVKAWPSFHKSPECEVCTDFNWFQLIALHPLVTPCFVNNWSTIFPHPIFRLKFVSRHNYRSKERGEGEGKYCESPPLLCWNLKKVQVDKSEDGSAHNSKENVQHRYQNVFTNLAYLLVQHYLCRGQCRHICYRHSQPSCYSHSQPSCFTLVWK